MKNRPFPVWMYCLYPVIVVMGWYYRLFPSRLNRLMVRRFGPGWEQ